mmetsp:Transcript_30647/g.81516  ORF Transcript_30647/g.81516 Transcript_30647/m.81516 type:complete len:92 (+) Transcript_30647:88-363(+)
MASNSGTWRRFNFFGQDELSKSLGDELSRAFPAAAGSRFFVPPDAAAYLTPRQTPPFYDGAMQGGMLFFGDSNGRIYVTDELLNPLGIFQV